jgi:hypothetical protein
MVVMPWAFHLCHNPWCGDFLILPCDGGDALGFPSFVTQSLVW